jgi:predicted acetyltransferase
MSAAIVRAVTGNVRLELVEATVADEPVLGRLLELYQHDFSEFDGADVDADGLYRYRYLDNYWTEPARHPFLFRVDGHWAGFALVRAGEPHDMTEFFVMRKYRRSGVGKQAARLLFVRFPGEWQVRQMRRNGASTIFWRDAIPVEFEQTDGEAGPVQRFTIS